MEKWLTQRAGGPEWVMMGIVDKRGGTAADVKRFRGYDVSRPIRTAGVHPKRVAACPSRSPALEMQRGAR